MNSRGMLKVQHDKCEDEPIKYAVRSNWENQCAKLDQLTYKFVRVEGGGTFDHSSEDDVMEVQQLLLEPQLKKNLDDDIMNGNSADTANCLLMNEISHSASERRGILGLDVAQSGTVESNYEFVDSILQGVDGGGSLSVTCCVPSVYPDYLLDTTPDEGSQVNCTSRDGLDLRNLDIKYQNQNLERTGGAGDISDFSDVTHPIPDTSCDGNTTFLDNMSITELLDAFRSMFGRDTYVKDKQWLKRHILFGLQNFTEIDNVSGLLECSLPSYEQEDDLIWLPGSSLPEGLYVPFTEISDSRLLVVGGGGGAKNDEFSGQDAAASDFSEAVKSEAVKIESTHSNFEGKSTLKTTKRLRKPTRRYIEEISEQKSKSCNGRLKPLTDTRGSVIHMAHGLHAQRGRPRKRTDVMGNEDISSKTLASQASSCLQLCEFESQPYISNDYDITNRYEKTTARRKHHRLWTISEVIKLVDGVSQYGVGRWTEIKRLLFSASAYRTSVDLKDKWRNLLRASGAQLHYKKQVEPTKGMSQPIPQHVLGRIRELSVVHPYPRVRSSRCPQVGGSSVSGGRKMTRRRSSRVAQKRS
ncbi:uncharacterized protein [Typha angustifolia]|uniref:uncharacterized protein isoform X2 n=1 Tax=Typha angustifolia TaxID=59011 RepID=UPI003C2E3442